MTAADLHNAGSAIEAAAVMNPGQPIRMDPVQIARMLMWAAAQLKEREQ